MVNAHMETFFLGVWERQANHTKCALVPRQILDDHHVHRLKWRKGTLPMKRQKLEKLPKKLRQLQNRRNAGTTKKVEKTSSLADYDKRRVVVRGSPSQLKEEKIR